MVGSAAIAWNVVICWAGMSKGGGNLGQSRESVHQVPLAGLRGTGSMAFVADPPGAPWLRYSGCLRTHTFSGESGMRLWSVTGGLTTGA